jgi:hypothetical protein
MILSNSLFNRDGARHGFARVLSRMAVWRPVLAWLPVAVCLLAGHAGARTLTVGADQELTNPSAAAREAESGDTVNIEPGTYYDCAVWNQNHLTIAGTGPGVVITDTTCQGKAIFIVTGNEVTIRDLTLARARVPDGNGAGIRLEGDGLNLERVRFQNDQVGLLSGGDSENPIHVTDCVFEGGGRGGDRPLYAVMVGESHVLHIEHSSFTAVMGGQVSTSALRTELVGNHIGDGSGDNPAVAVLATGGSLVMEDNVLTIGPNAPRLGGAVLATGEGTLALRRNVLENKTGQSLALLLNWTGTAPVGEGNRTGPGDAVESSSGVWWHRASGFAHGLKDGVHDFLGGVKSSLKALVGR